MATSAEIQKYSRHRDGHIEYFIKVIHNGKIWAIRKRFSEFLQLHEYLLKSGFEFDGTLPKKTLWKKDDENKLKKRCRALQDYLESLLHAFSLSDNSLLKEFFEVENTFLQLAKRQSFKEIRSTEKLSKLPKLLQSWMIAIPYTRQRSQTQHGLRPQSQQFHSPAPYSKTKSVSFSSFSMPMPMGGRNNSRKESFAGDGNRHRDRDGGGSFTPVLPYSNGHDGRDRKFSIDIFNLSYSGNMSGDHHFAAVSSAVKKSAFLKSTQVLWKHYQEDATSICADANYLKATSLHNGVKAEIASSSSIFRGSAAPATAFRKLVTTSSIRKSTLDVFRTVETWEEEAIAKSLLLDATSHVIPLNPHTRSGSKIGSADQSTLSLAFMPSDADTHGSLLSVVDEESVGVPIKDIVVLGFTQIRGSSDDSKLSATSGAGSMIENESVCTSLESLSVKG